MRSRIRGVPITVDTAACGVAHGPRLAINPIPMIQFTPDVDAACRRLVEMALALVEDLLKRAEEMVRAFKARVAEADEFYYCITPEKLTEDERHKGDVERLASQNLSFRKTETVG